MKMRIVKWAWLVTLLLPLVPTYAGAEGTKCPRVYIPSRSTSPSAVTINGERVVRPKPRPAKPLDCLKEKTDPNLCMACNLFFEARSEGSWGMELVGEVTLSRVDQNSEGRKTICDVVHARKQFSWTGYESAKIENLTDEELASWYEAQAIAYRYTNIAPENGRFNVVNPQLHCYNYYVSTGEIPTTAALKSKAPTLYEIYKQSTGSSVGDEMKPICFGTHIFMRDPNQKCSGSVTTMAENDDSVEMDHRDFYKDCLHAEEIFTRPSKGWRNNPTVCPGSTIQVARTYGSLAEMSKSRDCSLSYQDYISKIGSATKDKELCNKAIDIDRARAAQRTAYPDISAPPGIYDLPASEVLGLPEKGN